MHRKFLNILSKTSRPKSIKFGTNYPLVKIIQVCSNIGADPLQKGGGIITENVREKMGSFKNLILENYEARKAEFYMKAF